MKLFWGSIVFISLAFFAPLAFGQNTTTWQSINGNLYGNYNTSGNFNDSTKWDSGVPNSGTTAIIPVFNFTQGNGGFTYSNNNNTITVTVPSGQSAAALQFYDYFKTPPGTVNFNLAQGTTFQLGGSGLTGVQPSLLLTLGVTTNLNGGIYNIQSGFTSVGAGYNPGGTLLNSQFYGSYWVGGETDTLNISQATLLYGNNNELTVAPYASIVGIVNQSNNSVITAGNNFVLNVATYGINSPFLFSQGNGSYNLTGNSSISMGLSGTLAIGTGVFTEDATSSITMGSGSTIYVGATSGDKATLKIAGTLNVTNTQINVGCFSSNGTLNQTSGNITGSASLNLGGENGTGTYNLTGGNATFSQGLSIGQRVYAGTGALNQSGATTLTIGGAAIIGTSGNGTYTFSGGTSTFNNGLTIGTNGIVNQTGNTTLTSNGASTIAVGGVYTLGGGNATFNNGLTNDGTLNINGGTFTVGRDQLLGQGVGTINGGGGTLKLTGGAASTYTYAFAGTLTGGTSTIDVSASPATSVFNFASAITGSSGAGLLLNGNGSTVFNFASATTPANSNTISGVTGISNGTLNATQNDIAATNALSVGPGGTLHLNLNAGGLAYAGNVSGPGTLQLNFKNAGDSFVLANNSGFTGGVVIGANGTTSGTLQVYNGTFNSLSDNGSGSSVVVGGTPLTGNVKTPTSGLVLLPGANTYTGSTTITPGFTVKASNFGGNVINNGSLSTLGFPLNTSPINGVVSSMAIAGSLNSTGVINVFTDGQTADVYKVNGAGNSTLSGVVNTVGSGTNKYAVVTTGTGLLKVGGNGNLNDPNGLNTEPALTLFSSSLSIDPTSSILYVNTVQKPLIGFATTPAQRAVANNLDPLTQTPPKAFAPLLLIFNGLPASQIGPTLQSMSPINFQYSRSINFENNTFMVQKLNGVLSSLRSGYEGLDTSGIGFSSPGETALGQSLRSMLASNAPDFHTTAPNGVNYYPDDGSSSSTPASDYAQPSSTPSRITPSNAASPTASSGQVMSDSPIPMRTSSPPTLRTSKFSEFVAGDVALADINQNADTLSKASYTAGDIAAGVSYRMTSNLSVGVLFDFNHTNAKTDGNGSTTTINTYMPGVYATFFEKGFYANGLFGFGFNQYTNNNVIPLGGQGGTATSSPGGTEYVGNLDFGYDFHPAKQWVFGPTLGLTYTHVNIDSFSESGVPLVDLNVNSQEANSFRSRLGGHVAYMTSVGNIILQPNLTAMWQHEYINNNPGITSSFANLPAGSFVTPLSAPVQDSALLGCGLTATLNNSLAFYLNYLADVGGGDYLAQSIVLGVKASF